MANKDCKRSASARKPNKPRKAHTKRKNKHAQCIRLAANGEWHYPNDFLQPNPPPNHNALIGLLKNDTLNNVCAALSVIDDLFTLEPAVLSSDSCYGISLLLTAMQQALKFETTQRQPLHG